MTKEEKITLKRNWSLTPTMRVTIIGVTYREALSCVQKLRNRHGSCDFSNKPIEEV